VCRRRACHRFDGGAPLRENVCGVNIARDTDALPCACDHHRRFIAYCELKSMNAFQACRSDETLSAHTSGVGGL
jgi:hypothetical protein